MRPVSEQIVLFALMVTMGIVLGIIFDFYRAVRGIVEPGKVVTIIGDVIFWLIATALVFTVLMWQTWGEMRAYVLIGLVLGFIIHWYYFSPLAIKGFRTVLLFIIWIAKIIWRIISWPFVAGKAILLPPLLYVAALSRAGYKRVNNQKNRCTGYLRFKKQKCSNFVKSYIQRLFTKPPEDE